MLRDVMRNDFERMCIIYESLITIVHFKIYTIMYIILQMWIYSLQFISMFLCLMSTYL
jgi:hypothetical protein